MKKQSRSLILAALALAIFFSSIGFAVGYFRYSSQISEENRNRQKQQELLNALLKAQENSIYNLTKEDESTVTSYGDTITKETVIINKVFYTQCQDTIETEETVKAELIGLNEKGFKDYINQNKPGFEIEDFSKEKIVLKYRQNKVCPNHYLISINNGYIAVYKYDENGEKTLVNQTEIPVKMLPTVDQEKLQNGILVETLEDVEQLLEDFSS